jgi:hypothetical protein
MAFRPTLLARVLRSSTLFLGWPDEGVNSLFFHARDLQYTIGKRVTGTAPWIVEELHSIRP